MLKVAIGVVLFCVIAVTYSKHDYTEQVILALERTLVYMKKNAKQMNLDAMLGLVLAEANLQQQLLEGVPQTFKSKIRLLEYMANETLHKTKPHLKKNLKNNLFSRTVLNVKAWRKPINFGAEALQIVCVKKILLVDVSTVTKYMDYLGTGEVSEVESDNCIIELLIQQSNCCVEHKCTISPACQLLMIRNLRNILPAYGVTHNLLYLQIARSQECLFNKLFVDQKINVYCTYIYWEVEKNEKFGFLPKLDDLFLEQVTLCGYEGFKEFFKDSFIEHILSLQQDNGCFKLLDTDSRRRRDSNILSDGCIDHTTGLGASALSLILRYQLATI